MFSSFLQMRNPRKMGLPLHMVEEIPVQSSQKITFWKVLQEDDESAGTLGKEMHPAPINLEKNTAHLVLIFRHEICVQILF